MAILIVLIFALIPIIVVIVQVVEHESLLEQLSWEWTLSTHNVLIIALIPNEFQYAQVITLMPILLLMLLVILI